LGAVRRVRRADHAFRPGDVGVHLLRQVHCPYLLRKHRSRVVLHAGDHLALGAGGLPGRPAARQTVRVVLAEIRGTSGNAQSATANGAGKQAVARRR
jgi:hypothetical protein